MTRKTDPVQPADAASRAEAQALLGAARFAALAYTDPETGTPGISRIALGLDPAGGPVTLISSLALHFAALRTHPACALMVGEPGPKGDPLTHPRLMIRAEARFITPDDPVRPALRDRWLADHPKAKLYVDFADFAFVRLMPASALYNGGFARAFRLTGAELIGE
jgi:putative heme iron utilization protein